MSSELSERLFGFCEAVHELVADIPKNGVTDPSVAQLTRGAEQLQARFQSARGGDYKRTMRECQRIAGDMLHALRIIEKSVPHKAEHIASLSDECDALIVHCKRASYRI